MFLACHKKPAFRHLASSLASGFIFLGLEPAFTPIALPNNNLFQKFIQPYIERVRDQVLVVPNSKTRKKTLDRLLKSWNPNLYYGYLYIECYYFY